MGKIIDNHCRVFDAIVLKPYPLQHERTHIDTTEKQIAFDKDRDQVISCWESMWFYQFGRPTSKYWGRSSAWTQPHLEDFCKCFQIRRDTLVDGYVRNLSEYEEISAINRLIQKNVTNI